jgi:hypothetical protein
MSYTRCETDFAGKWGQMVGQKFEKFISKWKWILVLSLGCAIFVSFMIFKYVDQLPEKKLAEDFVRTNPEIKAYFGEVLSVSSGTAGSRITYEFDGTREGYYSFRIGGRKKSGQVVVRWYSEGSGINFQANSIELHEPWKNPVLIWSSEQRE